MSSDKSLESSSPISLRLWPGVAIVTAQWLARFALPVVFPDAAQFAVFGGLLGWVLLVVWWLFFSRAAWVDRIAAVVLMIGAMAATYPLLDVSLATGAMGFIFPMLAVPGISLAFVIWAVVSRGWSAGMRRVTMAIAIVMACLVWTLVRTGGFDGRVRQRPGLAVDPDGGGPRAGAWRRHATRGCDGCNGCHGCDGCHGKCRASRTRTLRTGRTGCLRRTRRTGCTGCLRRTRRTRRTGCTGCTRCTRGLAGVSRPRS